jgi:hypothetical protein
MVNFPQSPPPNRGGLFPPGQLFANTGSALKRLSASAPAPASATAVSHQSNIPLATSMNPFLTPAMGQANHSVHFLESANASSGANSPTLNLPPRPANALTGSQFWSSVANLGASQREQAIQAEILNGNVPDHLRQMKPLTLSVQTSSGETLHATAYVTPDYLAIGSNDDYVLVPMSPITGQAIADGTGTTLPTRKLVNLIYQQADVKLRPRPQEPGPQMTSTAYYARHDNTLREQRDQAGAAAGDLIAGHKKDVVITPRLDQKPRSVAIYGWHPSEGKPIQPLSTVHENTYADYSHGVRLVGPTLIINGEPHATVDVLRDPEGSKLLSDEGVIKNPRAVRP